MAKNDSDELMSIGVDIGKDTFHLVGFDHAGRCQTRSKRSVIPKRTVST